MTEHASPVIVEVTVTSLRRIFESGRYAICYTGDMIKEIVDDTTLRVEDDSLVTFDEADLFEVFDLVMLEQAVYERFIEV